VLRGYGFRGFQRVTDVFEVNVARMFTEALGPRGYKAEECGFVQMVAVNTDPAFDDALKGKGFARELLRWRMERHWEECRDLKTGTKGRLTPVILDTTTEQGVRSYERLGFEVVGRFVPETGTDKDGYKISKKLGKDERVRLSKEAKEHTVMKVMIKMPPDISLKP
jgi:GNAT superfamily N-acetyltransferase